MLLLNIDSIPGKKIEALTIVKGSVVPVSYTHLQQGQRRGKDRQR